MFIKRKNEAEEFEAGDLTILKEIANPINDKINIGYSLAEARLPLGEASLPHRLTGSELYYIIEGKAKLYINEESVELEKGDTAIVPPNALQYIENTGAEELRFLCVVEPFWRPESEHIV